MRLLSISISSLRVCKDKRKKYNIEKVPTKHAEHTHKELMRALSIRIRNFSVHFMSIRIRNKFVDVALLFVGNAELTQCFFYIFLSLWF